jgi:hypothetical protein
MAMIIDQDKVNKVRTKKGICEKKITGATRVIGDKRQNIHAIE